MSLRLALAALVALAQLGCTDGAPPASAPERPPLRAQPLPKPGVSGARREVRAQVVRVSIRIAESIPPQVFADVTSALPNGCTQFARADVRREGATILVDVFNSEPARDDVACTMIYREKETPLALGSDFVSGETYTIDANGTRETFVAQ
jgi:hypothetical protein